MTKQKNSYILLLIGMAFVVISYCITSNTLGTQYGTIFQFSKFVTFGLFMGFECIDIARNRRHLSISEIDVILLGMVFWNCLILLINGGFDLVAFVDIALWPLVFIQSEKWGKNGGHFDLISKPLVFILFGVIMFSIPNLVTHYMGMDRAGYAVGATLTTVTLSPIILSLKNDRIKKVLIISVAVVALVSLKRSAFICTILTFVSYYLSDSYIAQKKDRVNKIIKYTFICIIIGVAMYLIIQKMNTNVFERIMNISEDEGSGRIDIWESVIEGFKESPLLKKLFGHGYHSVAILRGRGQLAHNDFLEILYDYGVIGLSFAVLFVLKLLRRLIWLWKAKSSLFPVYLSAIIVLFVFSMISYLMVQSLRILFLIAFFGVVDYEVKSTVSKSKRKRPVIKIQA